MSSFVTVVQDALNADGGKYKKLLLCFFLGGSTFSLLKTLKTARPADISVQLTSENTKGSTDVCNSFFTLRLVHYLILKFGIGVHSGFRTEPRGCQWTRSSLTVFTKSWRSPFLPGVQRSLVTSSSSLVCCLVSITKPLLVALNTNSVPSKNHIDHHYCWNVGSQCSVVGGP